MTAVASGVGGRFTAGDVKASPSLHTAAVSFIQGYRGDFEFLVRMKEVFAMTGSFTDGQAKGVLNCMVYDPQGMRYINQAKEAEMPTTDVSLAHPSVRRAAEDRPPLFVVREREKPAWFDVKVRWKKFWLTTEVQGKSHHLNVMESRATYFREVNPGTFGRDSLPARIDFQMVTLCGLRVRSFSLFRRTRIWSLTAQPTKGVCLNCERKLEEA